MYTEVVSLCCHKCGLYHVLLLLMVFFFTLHRMTCQGCNQYNWHNAAKLKVVCADSVCKKIKWYLEETSNFAQWEVSFWLL